MAAQIANGYETAEVPMYSEQLRDRPDRKVIIKIIENLQKVFFPAYFAGGTVSHVSAETFAEFLLGEIYTDLREQVHLAFSNTIKDEAELRERTSAVCDRLPCAACRFMKDWPQTTMATRRCRRSRYRSSSDRVRLDAGKVSTRRERVRPRRKHQPRCATAISIDHGRHRRRRDDDHRRGHLLLTGKRQPTVGDNATIQILSILGAIFGGARGPEHEGQHRCPRMGDLHRRAPRGPEHAGADEL